MSSRWFPWPPSRNSNDDLYTISLPVRKKKPKQEFKPYHRKASKNCCIDLLPSSYTRWFTRPPHLKGHRLKPYVMDIKQNKKKSRISLIEESLIREGYPVTLGPMISDMIPTWMEDIKKTYSNFKIDVLVQQRDCLDNVKPRPSKSSSSSEISESGEASSSSSDEETKSKSYFRYKKDHLKIRIPDRRIEHIYPADSKEHVEKSDSTTSSRQACQRGSSEDETAKSDKSVGDLSSAIVMNKQRKSRGLREASQWDSSEDVTARSDKSGVDISSAIVNKQRKSVEVLSDVSPRDYEAEAADVLPCRSIYLRHLGRLKLELLKLEEFEILKRRRMAELQKLKPPKPKWYASKGPDFHDDAHRNLAFCRNEEKMPQIQKLRNHLWRCLIMDA